ncbi:MAG: aromatic amino acid lyase [Sphingomonadaceae bacterium]|nr:aromatic amino acid lyase [Sphingomonadaceae bacterium]
MIIEISGDGLTIAEIGAVARGAKVRLSDDPEVLGRVARSREQLCAKVARGEQIYGVTTLFGGMADRSLGPDQLEELQRVALWHHKSTTGPRLPVADVRAAMLLRANSLMKGVSGVRLEIVERFAAFLNAGAHPHVYQRGSIGASGDLVPLTYIAGPVMGLDPAFLVDLDGETLDAHAALARLGLKPLALEPKEGLALNNGTGASTGVAANALDRAMGLAALALGVHALYAQALCATDQSFAPFIHRVKPHPGQVWTAARMAELLAGSRAIRSEAAGERGHRAGKLIQDRYSLRCLPQYLGPVFDGIAAAARQVETEANCANDNPLIDPDSGEIYHTGNFLAQYTGVAMDSLRYQLGLLAKHVDVQIALLMTPEFSGGLSASLVGNAEGGVNVGLKSLQLGGNQMMPLLSFYGQSIVDRFPTHAEQFNQNINSQAMNSANLAREAVDVLEHYLSVALLIGVQAVELRAQLIAGSYDAREILSPATATLYEAARNAAAGPPDAARPLHWNDLDGFIQPKVEGILGDVQARGAILAAIAPVGEELRSFAS